MLEDASSYGRSIQFSLVLPGLLAFHPAVGVALRLQEAAQAHRCSQETEGVRGLPTGYRTDREYSTYMPRQFHAPV